LDSGSCRENVKLALIREGPDPLAPGIHVALRLDGLVAYTQPVDDTQATGSEKTIAASPAGASIGTAPGQRPNP
jgi:hypothetical protein